MLIACFSARYIDKLTFYSGIPNMQSTTYNRLCCPVLCQKPNIDYWKLSYSVFLVSVLLLDFPFLLCFCGAVSIVVSYETLVTSPINQYEKKKHNKYIKVLDNGIYIL